MIGEYNSAGALLRRYVHGTESLLSGSQSMMRLSGTFLLLLAAAACAQANDEAVIRDLERQLVLPGKADPLSRYDRYYALAGTIATGRFIRSEGREGKLKLVATEKDIPFVADGGCGVIEVRLDLEKKAWERPFCHGQ